MINATMTTKYTTKEIGAQTLTRIMSLQAGNNHTSVVFHTFVPNVSLGKRGSYLNELFTVFIVFVMTPRLKTL